MQPSSLIVIRSRAAIAAAAALLLASPAGAGPPEAGSADAPPPETSKAHVFQIAHRLWNSAKTTGTARAGFFPSPQLPSPLGRGAWIGAVSVVLEPLLSNVESCTVLLGEAAVCVFSKETTALNLRGLVSQLTGFGVDEYTTFWIEAWGGDGGDGEACCEYGGPGGSGGYAQIMTTLDDFETAFNGAHEIYYYLGLNGTSGAWAGGDGGTATYVNVNGLYRYDVTTLYTLLLAGGGGGGGAGRGVYVCHSYVRGETGGDGGVAIA
jgi:hypothetical protein